LKGTYWHMKYLHLWQESAERQILYFQVGPASWSSGQSLWPLIMRSRLRFSALPCRGFCPSHKFPNFWSSINGLDFILCVCLDIGVTLGISSKIKKSSSHRLKLSSLFSYQLEYWILSLILPIQNVSFVYDVAYDVPDSVTFIQA